MDDHHCSVFANGPLLVVDRTGLSGRRAKKGSKEHVTADSACIQAAKPIGFSALN